MANLRDNIKEYRKKNGLSQSEFASKLYVTKQAVSKWETGRGYPDSALIPEIAKVMDVSIDTLMGHKRKNKRLIIMISSLVLLVILAVVFIPMINSNLSARREFEEFKETVETTTEIDLPSKGSVVIADFDNWVQYNSHLTVSQMSYFVFDDVDETSDFELNLALSDKWTSLLSEEQIDMLPVNISAYATQGDYYSLYNLDSFSYNEIPSLPGTYEYMFLIYQLENNRLIVFDFSIVVEEGE